MLRFSRRREYNSPAVHARRSGRAGVGPDPELAEASALVVTLQLVVLWLAPSALLPSTALSVQFQSLLRENPTTIFYSWMTFK